MDALAEYLASRPEWEVDEDRQQEAQAELRFQHERSLGRLSYSERSY